MTVQQAVDRNRRKKDLYVILHLSPNVYDDDVLWCIYIYIFYISFESHVVVVVQFCVQHQLWGAVKSLASKVSRGKSKTMILPEKEVEYVYSEELGIWYQKVT